MIVYFFLTFTHELIKIRLIKFKKNTRQLKKQLFLSYVQKSAVIFIDLLQSLKHKESQFKKKPSLV